MTQQVGKPWARAEKALSWGWKTRDWLLIFSLRAWSPAAECTLHTQWRLTQTQQCKCKGRTLALKHLFWGEALPSPQACERIETLNAGNREAGEAAEWCIYSKQTASHNHFRMLQRCSPNSRSEEVFDAWVIMCQGKLTEFALRHKEEAGGKIT